MCLGVTDCSTDGAGTRHRGPRWRRSSPQSGVPWTS